jgi:Zn-dependent M16 (insulinase) family peptidase
LLSLKDLFFFKTHVQQTSSSSSSSVLSRKMFTTTATAAATMHYNNNNNNNNSNNVKKALNNVSSSNSNNSGFSKVAPVHRRRIVSNNRGRFITNQANNIKTVGAIASPADNATSPSMASMTAPKNLHGFELVKEEFVPEYNAKGFLFRHKKTGAELMSLSSDDENKSFGVTFRTPPQNSTGIPHILEHSVLCGSRKYPIKEPFVELIKGSLNTFLNAMTYPDRTCYPVASCNLADFYNLVDVYLDAVFHPKCIENERTFEQEGWHYELNDKDEDLTFKGVVFNEMKGVYSSPDSVLARECQQALFPDNTYGVDSGGSPEVIPDLTFAEFKDFHGKFYHPSNARLWFYGDDNVEERLKILNGFLDEFDPKAVDSSIASQSFFKEPKRVVKTYAAGEDEEAQKCFVQINWLLNDKPFDQETALAVGFLDNLLLGSAASPLRLALEESGLGEAIVGFGLEDELKQPSFAIGMKGVEEADIPEVEKLIYDTMEKIAKEGFSDDAIEASINSIEFSLRENNTGRFPRGLSMMLRSLSAWLYEGDPFEPLRYEEPLKHLKSRIASSEDVFRPLMRRMFLENTHRVTVELKPDQAQGERETNEEKMKLSAKKSSLSADEIEHVVAETAALKLMQETPDSPEALKCIPALALSDIPKTSKEIPCDVSSIGSTELLTHDLFTNDIIYAEHLLDMTSIPENLLPLVPLWTRALGRMGTSKRDFIEFDQTINAQTGGISVSPFVSSIHGDPSAVSAYMVFRGKATSDKADVMHDLMTEMLFDSKLDDQKIFKQLVLETRSGMEGRVQGSGHSIAASRLEAQDSVAGWVNEQMGGLDQLEYLRKLAKRVDDDWDSVVADLEKIRSCVSSRNNSITNLTGDSRTIDLSLSSAEKFLGSLNQNASVLSSKNMWKTINPAVNELLTVPTTVNYVGKGANLYKSGYELNGSSYVINKLLGTTWLWDRVRVSGGAYGGFSDFDSHSGMFTYLSYRDPNLLKTLDNYDGTVEFLRKLHVDNDELTKSIIGTIGEIDAYQLPDSKGYSSLMRHLLKITPEERQERREQILGTTNKSFKDFADALEAVKAPSARISAVCSPEAAKKAKEERPELDFKITRVI